MDKIILADRIRWTILFFIIVSLSVLFFIYLDSNSSKDEYEDDYWMWNYQRTGHWWWID